MPLSMRNPISVVGLTFKSIDIAMNIKKFTLTVAIIVICVVHSHYACIYINIYLILFYFIFTYVHVGYIQNVLKCHVDATSVDRERLSNRIQIIDKIIFN